jgi:hypothetical protein
MISQHDPLPGGYLGTILTTSLRPKAHFKWMTDTLSTIDKEDLATPFPPGIKQRLLIYRANSKIMHTHCLVALPPSSITTIDSKLEATCRKI